MPDIKKIIGRRLSQIRYDSKTGRRHSEFTLTKVEALKILDNQKGVCALTGFEFEDSGGSYYKNKNPKSLSFDRIDPTRGYTYENTMFVCTLVNNMRSNMSLEEFKDLCKRISNARY